MSVSATAERKSDAVSILSNDMLGDSAVASLLTLCNVTTEYAALRISTTRKSAQVIAHLAALGRPTIYVDELA